jgi:hypothetical protein
MSWTWRRRPRPAAWGSIELMEPDRARALLAAERTHIERGLPGLRREDVGELADQDEPADQASDLYENELHLELLPRLLRQSPN